MEFLSNLLSLGQFIPHGNCYLWKPELIGFHLVSDFLIAISYFSISLGIIFFIRQRKDLPYPQIFALFSAFIFACSLTHLMAVWTLWYPIYWLSGFVKAITGAISLLTAIIMVPLFPQALALPSPVELEEINQKLAAEIGDRLQTQTALQASEKRLAGILEFAHDAIISIDKNQKIQLFNQGAERIFGYSSTEVLKQPLDILLPERFVPVHKSNVSEFSNTSEVSRMMNQRGQIWARRKDGTEFPAEASISKLELEDETTFTAFLNDVSDRLAAEAKLKQALQRLTFHVENSPLAVIEWDSEFRVQRWSQQAEKLFGWKAEELIGLHPSDWKFVFSEDLETVDKVTQSLLDGAQPRNVSINRNYTKDGKVIDCEWYNSVLLDENGNLISVQSQVLDISDRVAAEAALRESEHRYQTLTEASPVGIFRTDTQGKCLYVNDRWCQMTGISLEDALGDGWIGSIHPEDRLRISREWYAAAKQNLPFRLEYRVQRPDNNASIWVFAQAVAERDMRGEVIAYVGTITDLSDRKQAEKELAKQQKTLRAILNNAPIWIWMTDTKGKMQFVNKTFSEDVGIPESRFLEAAHYADVLDEQDLGNCIASDAVCLAQDTPHHSEDVFIFVDGRLHELETIKAKIKDKTGEAIAIVGLAVDVTERKQVEIALQQSEAKYRQIARHEELLNALANQIRNSLDLDTILETAVREVRSFLQIDRCYFVWYRFARDNKDVIRSEDSWEVVNEAKEETVPSFIGEYSVSQVGLWSQSCLQLQIVCIDDVRAVSDPEMRDSIMNFGLLSLLSLPIQTQSGKIGVLACGHHTEVRNWQGNEVELLHAVTDQLAIAIDQAELYTHSRDVAFQAKAQARELADALKKLQQAQAQLIQTEKMSSLGQLVAGIAHEINNPVNFIFGNVSHANEYVRDLLSLINLYQQHYPAPVPEVREEIEAIELDFLIEDFPKILGSIQLGADRIRQIVLSLRNFSRLDEAEVKAVDIHEGIDNTLLILQNRLKGKQGQLGIQLIKEYGKVPLVECHAGQMNQVFMNILTNAMDAVEEKLRHLSKNPVDLAKYPELSEFLPTVIISTEVVNLDWVSIKFIDNGAGMTEEIRTKIFDPFFTTKPVGSGTGLGLSISYQIVVEKHRGQLDCVSSPEEGTEFIIQIPIKQKAGDR